MVSSLQPTTSDLWSAGRQVTIQLKKTTATEALISWTLPTSTDIYGGILILLSETKFAAAEFPEDSVRYVGSLNWANPVSKIGDATVVFSAYDFFGDNTTTTSVTVTGLDPNKIYYASAHICSSILQYFTDGVKSYPLESSTLEKQTEAYAGGIKMTTTPPQNPHNGQVFYDTNENALFIWNDTNQAWVRSTQKIVETVMSPPVYLNKLAYIKTMRQLMFFDGSSWVIADANNCRIKIGAAWAPYMGFASDAANPVIGNLTLVEVAEAYPTSASYIVKIFTIGGWFNLSEDLIQIKTGTTWTNPIIDATFITEALGAVPAVGTFIYDASDRRLKVWAGSSWEFADKDEQGTVSPIKVGIGTDGSYAERTRLIRVLKTQMGWPATCNELNEEQFNIAIDNALDTFRQLSDSAYTPAYVGYTLKRGQNIYYLNNPMDGTNKIVHIIKIHRFNPFGMSISSNESAIYAQSFFNQLYTSGTVDLVSIHLLASFGETYQKIFAGNIMFTWDEASRQMVTLRNVNASQERVLLEVALERTEQELLVDRWCKQWLQAYAESELWYMLGEIRSKYGSLAGPNGGITLNGDNLLARAEAAQTELRRQIADYEVGNGVNFGSWGILIG